MRGGQPVYVFAMVGVRILVSVLYVDDEEDLCVASSLFLKRKGFSVTTCSSATEALDILKKSSYDVIVSDYMMPGMDGISLLTEVRRIHGDIPFILFTGRGDEEVVIRAIEQKADYYVRKGNDPTTVFSDLAYTVDNVVERYKTKKDLFESEEKYRFLVTHALEPILIVDLHGTLLFANNAAAKMIEVADIPENLGRNVMEFISPESHEAVIRDFSEVARGHDSYIAEYEAVTSQGRPVTVESIGKLIHYEDNPAILLSLRDITDRKQIEKSLRKASKQINLMNSITRHDILNKVTIILGAIEIAEMECSDPSISHYFKTLESATTAIQKQIEFTRLYQDLGIHEPSWQSPVMIIKGLQIPEGLTLDVNLEEISVFADPMLEKVFFNLLDNSLRHGETVSHILVTGFRHPDGYTISWEDNGIGVRDNEKEAIFDRGHGKHTGLGLFLVREILALTGISIAETGTEGKGARFEITIPKGIYADTIVSPALA
ncbi:response regulator [Methanospirillum hungatei]|uniref:response regulator n=1 Tax=Methanospirillum hungatei TaxID=2203 RepID=UPI0026EBFCFB|nr:response regulator [Methanospirillum hungatei]MCA1915269.1 response regulator [Methanospirillum hungatei]